MRIFFNKILKYIFRVRYKSKEFKLFRAYVTNFYDNYDLSHTFNSYRITKIRMYNYPKSVVVEIYSLAPGLIIGIKGTAIDRFKSFIQKKYSKPVKIILEESNPFK